MDEDDDDDDSDEEETTLPPPGLPKVTPRSFAEGPGGCARRMQAERIAELAKFQTKQGSAR